jgi:recombination protein RecT
MKTDGSDQNTKNTENEKPKTLRDQLFAMSGEIARALPGKIGADRMMRIAMTTLQNTPNLSKCTWASFAGGLMNALQLGLEPNTPLGHCYLIPRYNKKKDIYICSFEMGYQGMLELAYRSKMYRHISARVVYQGDEFKFNYGTGQKLHHIPKWASENPEYVYAIYELDNGGEEFAVWSWGAILKHAEEFSESFDSAYSPWKSSQTSREGMGKKTALKDLLRYGPKSVELASEIVQAMNSDGNTVVARKATDEGGKSTVQFGVQYPEIEAPNEENLAPRQRSPAAERTASETKKNKDEKVPVSAGKKPEKGSSLFPQDEDVALAEQYERKQSEMDLPDFDRR